MDSLNLSPEMMANLGDYKPGDTVTATVQLKVLTHDQSGCTYQVMAPPEPVDTGNEEAPPDEAAAPAPAAAESDYPGVPSPVRRMMASRG